MIKLTKTQSRVLEKMELGKWYNAYELQYKRSTLDSLVTKEVLERRSKLGSCFFPRINIEYRIKPYGLTIIGVKK